MRRARLGCLDSGGDSCTGPRLGGRNRDDAMTPDLTVAKVRARPLERLLDDDVALLVDALAAQCADVDEQRLPLGERDAAAGHYQAVDDAR